ncbi:MAG: hypothetical protein ABW022_08960 [Actinoplanes sp.]
MPLTDPALVLLRIENAGSTDISKTDYAAPAKSRPGITVKFPDRKVVGMAVTGALVVRDPHSPAVRRHCVEQRPPE